MSYAAFVACLKSNETHCYFLTDIDYDNHLNLLNLKKEEKPYYLHAKNELGPSYYPQRALIGIDKEAFLNVLIYLNKEMLLTKLLFVYMGDPHIDSGDKSKITTEKISFKKLEDGVRNDELKPNILYKIIRDIYDYQ